MKIFSSKNICFTYTFVILAIELIDVISMESIINEKYVNAYLNQPSLQLLSENFKLDSTWKYRL